jgi:hypothetical protein
MSFLNQSFGSMPNYGNILHPTSKNSPFYQLSQIYPNLSNATNAAGNDITSELQGKLPTDVQQNIKDYGAAWGLESGMPGSGASNNLTLADLGLNSLGVENQGISNYSNFAPTLQSMFTLSPDQTASIDQGVAAPNPSMAGLTSEITALLGTLGGKVSGGGGGGGAGSLLGMI